MDYFLFSYPEIAPEWEDSPKTFDAIFNGSAALEAIEAVATHYQLTYEDARSRIVEYWKSQKTFSVYGLCNSALKSKTCAVGRFLSTVGAA